MKLSAMHIARWVFEAQEVVVGRTVSALHKDETRRLVTIDLNGPGPVRLIYLFLPGESLMYFETGRTEQARRPHQTTNFLPQLVGRQIDTVEHLWFDRVVKLALSGQDEHYEIIFELFGPSSNVFLLKPDMSIITSLKDLPETDIYKPPEMLDGVPVIEIDADKLATPDLGDQKMTVRESLEKMTRGCDASFWDIALGDVDSTRPMADLNMSDLTGIAASVRKSAENCIAGDTWVTLARKGILWTVDDRDQPLYARMNDAIADAAQELSYSSAMRSVRQRISQALRSSRKRLEGKLAKLNKLLAEAEDATRYKQWAELLTVNIGKIKRGMTTVTVVNLYDADQPEIAVPLQADLSPSANISRLFKKYRKLTDGIKESRSQVSDIERELETIDKYKLALGDADDLTDLLKLERVLVKQNILKKRKKPSSSHRIEPKSKPTPRTFVTSAGETILVGRNNRENEYVTFVAARKHDIWFHSQQAPGSHVILKLVEKGKQPSHESIIEVAQAAAYFSQARTSSKVPVIYTEVRYLQKIKGGPPGKVRYNRVKSIMVEPKQPSRTE